MNAAERNDLRSAAFFCFVGSDIYSMFLLLGWVARPESSKGVEALQVFHALRKASGRATRGRSSSDRLSANEHSLFGLSFLRNRW